MRFRLAMCGALVLWPSTAGAEPARGQARIEVGGEYDSNPSRAERIAGAPGPTAAGGSPLLRVAASGDVAASPGARHRLLASGEAAAKAFTAAAARGEDTLLLHGVATWSVRAFRRTALGASAQAIEVVQRGGASPRDFRSWVPALRAEQGLSDRVWLAAVAGYRFYTFKPAHDFDFHGPTAQLSLQGTRPGDAEGRARAGAPDWDWSAAVGIEARDFSGLRCTAADACPPAVPAGGRADRFWTAQVEATRTAGFLLGAGLGAHVNTSNSYGEALVRGIVRLRAVLLLPWQMSLSARAELVATRYRDAIPLARDLVTGAPLVSIEDEARSTARVEVARPIGPWAEAGVRYTLYTSEIGSGPSRYLRHTALVFAAVAYGR